MNGGLGWVMELREVTGWSVAEVSWWFRSTKGNYRYRSGLEVRDGG